MEAAGSGHSGRGSSISSEEEEEHPEEEEEEEEYMDMRGDIERPSELPLDFLDTFGFLDDDMMDTGEGAAQFEEFSVEPPCYEDEDCCSFSSEMYKPPPSLPSQINQLNQFKTESDSDEDVQFYSLPDYLDRPDLRIWETDTPVAARIDHETDQLEDTGDPAEENDQTAPPDTLDLQASRGQSDEGVKPTSGPGDEGRGQCAGDAAAGTPVQDSETSYTCGEMRAIDLNSRDPPEEPSDASLLLRSTETSDMQSFVESSRGCPTEAQIESVAGLESGSPLCSTDVLQLAQDPDADLQGDSTAVLEASEMPAEGNTDGKQLRVEPEGVVQPKGSGVDEGPIGDPEKLLGNQEALPEILQDDETGGVCKEDEKQAVASYEDSKDGLSKVRVFVHSLVDHCLASIETHGKNACSEMGSVLVGKTEILGNELSLAEADPVKQMDVEVDSVEEVIMEEGGGSEAEGVDGTGDHETGGMVQEVGVGGSSDGRGDAEEIEEGFTREMKEAAGKPEGLGEATEVEMKESGGAGGEMGVASAKVGDDQTGSEKEGVEGDGSKHSREREDSEIQSEARLEGMEGARMQVVASTPTKPRPKLYQAKSVPVVAPKPQFSKLPPALKIKHQLHQQELQSQLPGSEGESEGRGKNRWSFGGREGEAEGEGERGKRNGASPGASRSFDEAVARARDRHCTLKVWRIQACGEQSSLQALPKQLRHSHC
ncbi:hypothetical protein AOXY_G33644, partial [Acipenser oxyrinchus oxyrinchus]